MKAIYTRKASDNFQFKPVPPPIPGRNYRNSQEPGPFYVAAYVDGNQKFLVLYKDGTTVPKKQMNPALAASSIPEAFQAAELYAQKQQTKKTAEAQGLVVMPEPGDENRITLRTAVDHFLDEKKNKTPGTLKAYRHDLEEFLEKLPAGIRYVDQIVETKTNRGIPKRTSSTLENHMDALKEDGLRDRTIFNKMQNVIFMLKAAGIPEPSKLVTLPEYEEESAVPYSKEELKKLFAAMDEDDKFLFCFFLDTACRKGEVAHAQWADIVGNTYYVRSKEYKKADGSAAKWTVKTHESRHVPLTRELFRMVEQRRKTSTSKWIFPNESGNPDNDNGFIRRLKRVAKQAGLICGECESELKKTDRYGRNPRHETVSCADNCQICDKHYLHRFRKTKATHWHNTGVPTRTIQKWLGHKSLETTMIYLGIQDTEELQAQINTPVF